MRLLLTQIINVQNHERPWVMCLVFNSRIEISLELLANVQNMSEEENTEEKVRIPFLVSPDHEYLPIKNHKKFDPIWSL